MSAGVTTVVEARINVCSPGASVRRPFEFRLGISPELACVEGAPSKSIDIRVKSNDHENGGTTENKSGEEAIGP
jgi:hypothetical protein